MGSNWDIREEIQEERSNRLTGGAGIALTQQEQGFQIG